MRQASAPAFLFQRSEENPLDWMGSVKAFVCDRAIIAAGTPARHIHRVQQGCVRTFVRMGRGRRFDLAFHFPGDYFGLEAGEKYSVSAEAVSDSVLIKIPKARIAARAAIDLAVARYMIEITNRELKRAQEHRKILYHSVDERVVRFLLNLKKRFKRKAVELVMARPDIADHLNITAETLARALTRLHNNSAISLESQRLISVNFRRR